MTKCLDGVTVVITRPKGQADEALEMVRDRGGVPIELAVTEIVDPDDDGPLKTAFAELNGYDWLICTSVNTAKRIKDLFPAEGKIRVAAIGSETAKALEDSGIAVELVPPEFVAESLVEIFPPGNGRVLLPRAKVARDVLPDGLLRKGWTVDIVEAYQSKKIQPSLELIKQAASAQVITFTSPSNVDAFVDAAGVENTPTTIASIGPVTSEAVRSHGLQVTIEPSEHSVAALIQAVGDFFDSKKAPAA